MILGVVLPVFLVFMKGQFDIVQQIVIRRPVAEVVGGAVAHHKTVQLITFEAGYLEYNAAVEAVVDILVPFLILQPLLKGKRSPGLGAIEHLDQLIQIDTHASSVRPGRTVQLETRLLVIEDLGVILPVLKGVIMIVARHHLDFFKGDRIYMKGDVEAGQRVDVADGEFGGLPAKVGEVERIFYTYGDSVVAIGVRGGTPSHGAHDTDPVQRLSAVHIVYRPVDGYFLPPGPKKEQDKKG